MKKSNRLQKQLNRLLVVWLLAALAGAAQASKMEGHVGQQSLTQIVVGK